MQASLMSAQDWPQRATGANQHRSPAGTGSEVAEIDSPNVLLSPIRYAAQLWAKNAWKDLPTLAGRCVR